MTDDPKEWARRAASTLRTTSGADRTTAGHLAAPIEFLRRYAGSKSAFVTQAVESAKQLLPKYAALAIADALDAWVSYKDAGFADSLPIRVRIRVEAANDLMEQAGQLLADKQIHPTAPVALSGAALEEFLRSLVDRHDLSNESKRPGINTYAQVLKEAGVLTAQDVKDITASAGVRNDAAHGRFDVLSLERAGIMIDGINLFMRSHSDGDN